MNFRNNLYSVQNNLFYKEYRLHTLEANFSIEETIQNKERIIAIKSVNFINIRMLWSLMKINTYNFAVF
jgi:hypothetical protein